MNKSIATELVELAKREIPIFFKDQYQEAHALLPERLFHGVRIQSREFRLWLSKRGYEELGRVPNSESISSSCATLAGIGFHDGRSYDLNVRVGMSESRILYDLGSGDFVEINCEGWKIMDSSPVFFRSLQHQKRQVSPVTGGKINDLLKFINLSEEAKERGMGCLVLVWIISSFIPGYPHPVLVVHGPHGAAKSSLFRLIKTLIDPSQVTKLSPPSNPGDFAVSASRHWFVPLDNLSYLPDWLSDSICRACTGDGISKRVLFTDGEEHIISFQVVQGINGISLVADKPDLLDRSILVELKPLGVEQRRQEIEYWKDFEVQRPFILGAVFDVLSGALREYPNVKLKSMPRMADFACWGVAIARSMGLDDATFLSAYEGNIHDQHEEAVDASPVARCLIEFMVGKNYWEATATDLLVDLNAVAQRLKVDTKAKFWPKDPNWVWKRLVLEETPDHPIWTGPEFRIKASVKDVS